MSSVFVRTLRAVRPTRTIAMSAAAIALLITLVAWTTLYRPENLPYALEVSIQVHEPASTQIYFDFGEGLRETNSTSQRVRMGMNSVHLPLPAGKYVSLRFDPIDRGGTASFSELEILGPRGTVVRRISPTELIPNHQVETAQMVDGLLLVKSTADANDPQFTINFDPALELAPRRLDQLVMARAWLLGWFGVSFIVLILAENTWRHRTQRTRLLIRITRERPRLALVICAALAAILSSYPVIFFGKSFVSPNTTHLLYEKLPTVPGYLDARPEDSRGADVGAMLWQHFPYTVIQSEALKEYSLPLWNRYASSGVTLLGQGQSIFGDPLHLFVVLTGGEPWAFDAKYVLMKALFACGLGWCVWAFTRDFAASAILTFASVFIAFFNYRINHPSIFSMAYAPWILAAWLHLTNATDRRAFRNGLILWYGANWMIVASGTVKEAYMLAVTLNLTGAAIFFTARNSLRQKLQRGSILALAAIAFVLTSSPLWWTFLESLSTAYTAYNVPGMSQIPGERLVGLFDDVFYRPLTLPRHVYKPAANFLILLGCLWAILQPRQLFAARGPFIVLLATLLAISLAFRFGPVSWMSTWALSVPFLRNVYNLDTVFSCVAIVHLSVLAGWGFSAARRPLRLHQESPYGWIMGLVALALFVPYFAVSPEDFIESHHRLGWSGAVVDQALLYAHTLGLPLAAWCLVLIAGRKLRGTALGHGTTVVTVIALAILLGRHGQHLRFTNNTYIAAPGPRVDLQSTSPAVKFLQHQTATEPGRVQGLEWCLFAGFSTIYGLEGINGANALENRHYREFAEAAKLVEPARWVYETPVRDLPRLRPIFDFLNVRYLAEPGIANPPLNGYRRVGSFDLNILESEHSWPRAFFTDRIERYSTPDELVTRIGDRANQPPFAAMQESDLQPSSPDLSANRTEPGITLPAVEYSLKTNTTAFTVVAPKPGVAVLHEAWLADDFIATLNGNPVPYLRINHTFKGVVIPAAGSHRIEFTHSPRGFNESLIVSVLGLGLIVGSLFATRGITWSNRSSATSVNAST